MTPSSLAFSAAGTTIAAAQTTPSANPLQPLGFLVGRWRFGAGDSIAIRHPEVRRLTIIEQTWVVGRNAMRYREHVLVDQPENAEVEGTIYWDPAEERIRFIAVAGHGEKQGRLFVGEYQPLADGRVQRVYDVFYRTLEDTPGEELGGSRRRFREVLEPRGANQLHFTLEWWRSGRWERFAQGAYTLERVERSEPSGSSGGLERAG